MIRKSIITILGGVAFAAVLSLTIPASAASCLGLCADRIGSYYFAGCNMTLSCPGPGGEPFPGPIDLYSCTITDYTCTYTEGPSPVDPNIAE